MKKKKIRRCFLSCRQVKHEDYQKLLLSRFSIIFAKTVDEAELVLLPRDEGTLTPQQIRDLKTATAHGINCWILSPETIINMDASYPLEISRGESEYDLCQGIDSDRTEEEEMELIL